MMQLSQHQTENTMTNVHPTMQQALASFAGWQFPQVRRNHFNPDIPRTGFVEPCCWCTHRHGSDTDEPCSICDHNANAKEQA
jgi:hypothetical protein